MKRTATTLALLAGFGGGCVSPGANKTPEISPEASTGRFGTVSRGKQLDGYQGPNGEPVLAARAAMPTGGDTGVRQAGLVGKGADCPTCAHVPGAHGSHSWANSGVNGGMPAGGMPPGGMPPGGYPGGPGFPGGPGGPGGNGFPGILPVPGMGAPGAVAAFGAIVPGMGGPGGATGAIPNGRASIKFTGPAGMKVTWQTPGGGFNDESSGLTAPKEYNFLQGQVYRLRLTQILPNHPGRAFYPTLEIAGGNPKTLTFLAHASVPITFTNDDFDHAVAGNLVVKVVYLPDRDNQDFLTVVGAEEVNSTRLEPGVDPVAEAQRKGSILAIIRLGNIDLENRDSPGMGAPPPGMIMPPGMVPPGMMMPPGMMPPQGGVGGLPPGTSSVGGPIAPPLPGTGNALPSTPTTPFGPVAPSPLPPNVGGSDRPIALPPTK